MKKVSCILFFFVLFSSVVVGQKVLDKVSDLACECFKDKVEKGMDKDNINLVLGLCILESSKDYKREIKRKHKIDLSSNHEYERFGELLGGHMAARCDKFMEIIFLLNGDGEENETVQESKPDNTKVESNGGPMETAEILDIREGNILVLTCKVNGRLLDVYCIESFEGADLLKDLTSLKNKTVHLSYRDKTIYSSELKSFIVVAELVRIELVEE